MSAHTNVFPIRDFYLLIQNQQEIIVHVKILNSFRSRKTVIIMRDGFVTLRWTSRLVNDEYHSRKMKIYK